MSEKLKQAASSAPPINGKVLEPVLILMEKYIRKPLEGTLFDKWIASPMKQYYIAARRRD